MANIQIKRKTASSTYENLYPATVISQVDGLQTALDAKVPLTQKGVANGVATLDANIKIPIAQLPDAVFDSLLYYGSTTGNVGTEGTRQTLAAALIAARAAADSADRSIKGYYFLITTGGTISDLTGIFALGSDPALYVTLQFRPTDGGTSGSTSTSSGVLEAGDWFVIEAIGGGDGSSSGAAIIFTASVINNVYENAGTANAGIVTVVGTTQNAGRYNASTNATGLQDGHTDVVTENFLYDNITVDGTDLYNSGTPITNKIAPASHTHSQYQPLDATLTNFAGLTIAADTLVYGNGNDTFTTMSLTAAGRAILDDADTTAQRATLGLVIGTNVQGYSAKLADIAGLAVTDGNFIVGNGTNFVAESGITVRESLGVYSTSEVDTLVTNSISNKPNIYYDLAKTTADSTAPIGSYIYDDLSTSNGW